MRKKQPSYRPNPGGPRRALSQARRQRVKQAEVEVKVERRRLLPSQPRPVPQPFRKLADFFGMLLGMRQDFTAWVLYSQISIVERLLGHRGGRMTQCYAHLAPENLREAVQVFKDDYHKLAKPSFATEPDRDNRLKNGGGPNGI